LFTAALAVTSATVGFLSVGAWPIHPVEYGSYSFASDIVVDSQGNVHIVLPMGRLYYATNAHGGWSISLLDDVHEVWDAALAKDSNDRIHVAYTADLRQGGFLVGPPSIRYLRLDGDVKTAEVVDTNGRYPAIALDSVDRVHVTYADWTSSSLKYATRVGGTWTNTTVVNTNPGPIYSAIAVDSKGAAHVTYTGFTPSEVGYATNEGGRWTSGPLVTGPASNSRVPIAVDGSDRIHVAFLGCLGACASKTVVYAVREQGSWAQRVVAPDGVTNDGFGVTLDLALDPLGRPHLLFSDRAAGTLFYAAPEGERWVTRIVDQGTLGTLGGSLAIARDGRVAIAYYRVDGGRTDTGSSARVALSGLRSDNLLDFLSAVSLYPMVEGAVFGAVAFVLWRRSRRSELSGRAVRG
jgi:nitrate reductase NapE component